MDNSISIPSLEYLKYGNTYAGSNGTFQYKLVPDKENIHLSVWQGINCCDKSEIAAEAVFSLSEDGYGQISGWLQEQFELFSKNLK
jgi:hypothetical protein